MRGNMEILTGSYCGQGRETTLLLREAVHGKEKTPVAFFCLMKGADAPRGRRIADAWFGDTALPLCRKGRPEKAVDAALRTFERKCALWEAEMAALFCMGRECFYVWKGGARICAVNLCFDRLHLKDLTAPQAAGGSGRAVLEQGVSVILGDESFFGHLSQTQLKDCLQAGEISCRRQAQNRLREAAEAAIRQGAAGPAAAFLAIREDAPADFERCLWENGYGKPEKAVGCGAFGRVYRVRHRGSGRQYACKVAEDMDARRILRQEGALLKTLGHPLFADYGDLLEGDSCTLLLMEYVRGRDLSGMLEGKSLSERRAVDMTVQLAEGLRYLHSLPEPILYRDLKPENIRVMPGGRVRLLDLGCACRLAETESARAGSRGYAAPEQLEDIGIRVGFYSDIYALGRLLARMTEGRKISPGLNSLISKCISENPSERFNDVSSLLTELRKQS